MRESPIRCTPSPVATTPHHSGPFSCVFGENFAPSSPLSAAHNFGPGDPREDAHHFYVHVKVTEGPPLTNPNCQ